MTCYLDHDLNNKQLLFACHLDLDPNENCLSFRPWTKRELLVVYDQNENQAIPWLTCEVQIF
jgi:hypothetical protein